MVLAGGQNEAAIPAGIAGRFGQLYEQYFTRVYRYVNYRVGDRTTAEELTSDIFNKAINRFADFDPDIAGFSTWIFSIARNTLIDYYRERGRAQKIENELKIKIEISGTSPEEAASRAEDRRKLRECLDRLKAGEKEIIALKFSGGMNNREIARLTGMSESNVGTILYRAIRKLRDDFAGWQNDE